MDASDDTLRENPAYRRRLVGLTLGMLAALWLLPATGWLVRDQLRWQIPRETRSTDLQRLAQVAERHPEDYPLQLASALAEPAVGGTTHLAQAPDRLRALRSRFPEQPSLYANILRMATMQRVVLRRYEDALLEGKKPQPERSAPVNPEELAAFDEDAAAGERLDPDNAYFPAMRALGLFAARRDEEALAALHRAAQKSGWEEYYGDQVHGEWRLHNEAFGRSSAIERVTQAAMILFPHYASLRAAARVATYTAVRAEAGGRIEEGFRIRRSISRIGALLRVKSRSSIGSFVGISMLGVAATRPGGASPSPSPRPVLGKENEQGAINTYHAYLERIGHGEEARWFRAEDEAARGVKALVAEGNSRGGTLWGSFPVLFAWWAAGLLTVANALWMLLLGGLAALLGRSRRIRAGQPLPTHAKWGALGAVLLIAIVGGMNVSLGANAGPLLVLGAGLTLAGALGYAAAFKRPGVYRGVGALAVTVGGLLALGAAAVWHAGGLAALQGNAVSLVLGPEATNGGWVQPALAVATLAVPLLTLLLLGVSSLILRVPLTVGVVRGFRAAAVPVTCVLLLAYGGIVLVTTHQEARATYLLERTVEHEGHVFAEAAGKPWPGPTR